MWIKISICLTLVIFSSFAEESSTKKTPSEGRDKRNLEYQISHPYSQTPQRSERRISNIAPPRYSNSNHFPGKTYTYFRKGSKPQNQPLPNYAVQMEPLVHYSQRDPLYDPNTFHLLNPPHNELTKHDDLLTDNNHLAEQYYGPPRQYIDRPVYIKEPEPIIEIIIKEANSTAAAPQPIIIPQKKKKEEVQVFYVKYKKNPHGTGKDSVIYDKPIPALSPIHGEAAEDHEEQGYATEYPVTAPPQPATTIRAIIKPDSESYHAHGGIHVTFGGSKHNPQAEKYDDDIVESAPHPAVSHPESRRFPENLNTNQEYRPEIRAPQPYRPFSFNQAPSSNFGSNKPIGFGSLPPLTQNLPSKNVAEFSRPPQTRPYQFESRQPQSTFQFPRHQTHFPIQQQPTNQQPPSFNRNAQFFNTGENKQSNFGNQFNGFGNQNFNHHSQQFINTAQFNSQHTVSHNPQNNNQQHLSYTPQNNGFNQQANSHKPTVFSQQPQFPPLNQRQPSQQRDKPPQFTSSINSQFPQTKLNQNEFPPLLHQSASSAFPNQEKHHSQFTLSNQGKQQQFAPSINSQFQQNKPTQNEFPPLTYNTASGQFQNQEKQFPSLNHGSTNNQNKPNQQFSVQNQYHKHENLNQFNYKQTNQQSQPQVQTTLHQPNQFKQDFRQQQPQQQHFIPPGGELIAAVPKFEQHISIPPQRDHLSANEFTHQIQQQFKDVQLTPTQNFQYSTQATTTSRPINHYNNYYTQTATPTRRIATTTTPPTPTTTPTPKTETTTIDFKALNIQLPDEVPDDLRQQLLSSGILQNAQISVLDYDKVGDIPISALPPDQLANFYGAGGAQQIAAGSEKKETMVAAPVGFKVEDQEVGASESDEAKVKPPVEMKVVHYDPQTRQGQSVQETYVNNDATRTNPVVLNDRTYNRYLPLKVSGAKFPIPEVPELKGKNINSVVVLAPIDYNFSKQRVTREASYEEIKYLKNEPLKKLLDNPTAENYRDFLEKENGTSSSLQSVILLVAGSGSDREIYLYDVNSRSVSKLDGELSTAFVDAAENNASAETNKPNSINDNSFAPSNLVETKVLAPDGIDSNSYNGDETELEAAASDLYESRVPIIDPMQDDLEAEGSEQLARFVDISGLPHEDLVSAADSNEHVYISSGYSKTEHQLPSN